MDPIDRLVENAMEITYEKLPLEVVSATKMSVLDTFGCLIAGSHAPGCQPLIDLISHWGGAPESIILVHGVRAPAHNAALANSTMAHALDFDNAMDRGLHPSASSVPAAVAASEMVGGITGKELITSVAVGEDLAARIHMATTPRGFDGTGICMVLGTAIIAARILKLDKERTRDALGIAFNFASGNLQGYIDGALAMRVSLGYTASVGIMAALLASKGISGTKNVLGGLYGFFSLFSGKKPNETILLDQLGKKFLGASVLMKIYPSCGMSLTATDAVVAIIKRYNIASDEINSIDVHLSKPAYKVVAHPFEVRHNPQVDAQFSIQYCIANVVLRGEPKLKHFTEEMIKDPRILQMVHRVNPILDRDMEKDGEWLTTLTEVKTKSGGQYSQLVKYARGFPQNPVTMKEVIKKFYGCVQYSGVPFIERNAPEIVAFIGNLENETNATDIVKYFIG